LAVDVQADALAATARRRHAHPPQNFQNLRFKLKSGLQLQQMMAYYR
jgi:DNA topoisomerase IB